MGVRLTLFNTDTRSLDVKAAAVSGIAAGAAYLVVLEVDLRLTGRHIDDLTVLGRPFVADPRRARIVGVVIHAINSLGLAALYAVLERRIPGRSWLKGVVFANVENLILYPITVFEDRHPAVRDGLVDRYFTWPAFWQSVPRHIVFGAVLGAIHDRLRSTPGTRR